MGTDTDLIGTRYNDFRRVFNRHNIEAAIIQIIDGGRQRFSLSRTGRTAVDNQPFRFSYHLQVFFGGKHEEICVVFTVQVPKSDPHVPTISGLIPGAVNTEREKQDMIGVTVDGIPESRRIFLPDDLTVTGFNV